MKYWLILQVPERTMKNHKTHLMQKARLSEAISSAIRPIMKFPRLICLLLALLAGAAHADPPSKTDEKPSPSTARKISPELTAALKKLDLPGVKINLEEWCVDVKSRVSLKEGLLELIACVKDTKDHEAIIAIEAKPSHVHTALLLLGAKPGSPAMPVESDSDKPTYRFTPPSGSPVDVFLVIKKADGKEVESPITDFIKPIDEEEESEKPANKPKVEKFPTHTFLFAGSILVGEGDGPRRYLCDTEGNVISISTFGDELLCLPGIHDQSNSSLMWQVDGEKLPELDSEVTLRLRPVDEKKKSKP